MYKYITILGAAGQIAQKLTATLLTYTDMHLTLYGRQLSTRLHPEILEHERVTVIEGSFQNPAKLEEAVTNAEIVFVGAMESGSDMAAIVKALSRKNVRRVIGLSMAGLSGEFPAALEKWTFDSLPISYVQGERQARNVLRESNLNYTILRLTWLYNDSENTNYELIPEGVQFNDAQVTREAVVKAIFDILHVDDETPFHRASIGIGEPGTHYDKPSFH
ncbi:MAG: NAD(P)H-binding protein [Veillonella sp.]|uniref:NAD(P)H-binding protein n=1 Tax=Veillonella sp. TaxID=1926307 RepID=UPI0010229E18|nr:NAD(P)H-binding protein [Veillonella sp.]MTG95970.1 NAD(P)H-binding protein [Veillonella dispar]MBS5765382.1 NAD(P)H-binding protein [Veillonella sp.]MDU5866692.1 NAD(P)H-binding protein [Veillonella sp.]MTH37752.1 NAD(P)H-binding protein [Veillonella dispar]RYS56100.1 epimerase [Veillonella dispar]